jgi:hypothetical protein
MIDVRVANVPERMMSDLPREERLYYKKKARKVARILRHRIMQSLLRKMIESEDIDLGKIRDVRIMVLPSTMEREYGDHLYGLYDPVGGQISIYPAVRYKGSKFLTDPMVSFQFARESFDTMIHEILHSKYCQERIVRRLTRKYLKRLYRMLSKNLD